MDENAIVYCIADMHGRMKIGKSTLSKNQFYNRFSVLQTGNADDLRICYIIQCDTNNVNLLERTLQYELNSLYIRGEWYNANESDICYAIKRVGKRMDDAIDIYSPDAQSPYKFNQYGRVLSPLASDDYHNTWYLDRNYKYGSISIKESDKE